MASVAWTSIILSLEALALAAWAAASTAPTAVALAGVGLSITLGTCLTPPSSRARRNLYNWAGRLHRCTLAYNFSSADCLAACAALPAAARLCCVVLAKAGVANVGVLSLVLQPASLLLAAQQAAMALLLAKRVPAMCAAAGNAHLPLPGFARSGLRRWLPSAARLLDAPADHPQTRLACYSSVAFLIVAFVLALPLAVAWLRRGRHGPAQCQGAGRRAGIPEGGPVPGTRLPAHAGGADRIGGRPRAGPAANPPLAWEMPSKAFLLIFGSAMVAALWDLYHTVSTL
jgi:hypothetical protein